MVIAVAAVKRIVDSAGPYFKSPAMFDESGFSAVIAYDFETENGESVSPLCSPP